MRIKIPENLDEILDQAQPYKQIESEEYLKAIEKADKEIELEQINKGKTWIKAKNYFALEGN